MSTINHNITHDLVIPNIHTRLFAGHETARFAVGMIANGDSIMQERGQEYLGYLRLRANVYADQMQFIPKEEVAEDGTETDRDDSRSVHFAIIENAGKNKRVVAAMRLITKSKEDARPLPIEEFFHDEAFADEEAPIGSTEVSRYICRHENPKVMRQLKWPLYTAGLTYVTAKNLGPTFAVVEKFLEIGLNKTGIPISRIAEPKFVPEYNSHNMGIKIDTHLLGQLMGITTSTSPSRLTTHEAFTYLDDNFMPISQAPVEQAQAV